MQWLEREWSDKVGATWRRWIFATVIPTQRETKADTRVLLVKPLGDDSEPGTVWKHWKQVVFFLIL